MEEDHTSIFHQDSKDSRLLGNDHFMKEVYAKSKTKQLKPPSLNEIIRMVAEHYELEPSELARKGRGRKQSEARSVVAWLATKSGATTLTEVAKGIST